MRLRVAMVCLVIGGFLGAASTASALTLGSTAPFGSTATSCVGASTYWPNATDPTFNYTVPAGGGTITSWSTNTSGQDTAGEALTLLVLRPNGASFTVIAGDNETLPSPLPAGGITTFNLAAPITVAGGDVLSLYSPTAFDCRFSGGTIPGADAISEVGSPGPIVGTQYTASSPVTSTVLNLSANLNQSQDVAVTGAATPSAIVIGGAAAYTFTVTDNGRGGGPITFTDTVPGALRVLSAAAGPGSCTIATGQAITCTITGLAPGSAAQVVIVVLSLTSGSFPDIATVSTTLPDPTPVNNSVATTLSVTPAQACTVIKLAGAPLSIAKGVISALNCRIGKTTKKTSKKVPKGDVISTSPGAGQTFGVGTKVNIVESSGPPPKKKPTKKKKSTRKLTQRG